MFSPGAVSIGTLPTTQAILVTLALLVGVAGLPPADARGQDLSAHVEVEFLSDGRCTVSSAGDGFRSHATYMPVPGAKPAERRCAMPPVPGGQRVEIVVSLPIGTPRPGSSVPTLEWVETQGRWVGTARLTDWPHSVVVQFGGWLALRNLVTAAVSIAALIVAMTIATYARRRRRERVPGRG
jgi:hypothetical protein